MRTTARHETTLCLAALVLACGARSSLEVPPPERPRDAGMDAGRDGGHVIIHPPPPRDAGPDVGRDGGCVPGLVGLETGRVAVVFAIDRSESMLQAFDGSPPTDANPSRFAVLGEATREALNGVDSRLLVGGEFFPDDEHCMVRPAMEVPIGAHHEDELLSRFAVPPYAGGTPIGVAVSHSATALVDYAEMQDVAPYIVLATDGAPSCPRALFLPDGGVLDTATRLAEMAVDDAHSHGIDVFVVGIAPASLSEIGKLDELAVRGGRARVDPPDLRYFYSAPYPDALRGILSEITAELAHCVFALPYPPSSVSEVRVLVGGVEQPLDERHHEGWDWSGEARSQLAVFGDACRAIQDGASVTADIVCRP